VLKIALTGGAGSGKSTVARMLAQLGAVVLDADRAAREVVRVGEPAWEGLRREFGTEYFTKDGELDRPRLARLAFADHEARRRLNAILHPAVTHYLARRLAELAAQGVGLVIVEVPLLFEVGLEGAYDRVIVVYAGPEDQEARLAARDRRPPEEIAGILAAQWPLTEKRDRADYVVDNRGAEADTRRQVENIWRDLRKLLTREKKKDSVPGNLSSSNVGLGPKQ